LRGDDEFFELKWSVQPRVGPSSHHYFARESTFVCVSLSVCPRAYLRSHARQLYQIFVHFAYLGRGSVLLRQNDKIRRGLGSFGIFLPIDNALQRVRCTGYHSISAGKGWRQCSARAKCDLRLPCYTWDVLTDCPRIIRVPSIQWTRTGSLQSLSRQTV